jgi:hypothetical protein
MLTEVSTPETRPNRENKRTREILPGLAGFLLRRPGMVEPGRAGLNYRRLRDFSSVLLASESLASRPENPLATRGTDVRRTDVRLRVRVMQLLLSEST